MLKSICSYIHVIHCDITQVPLFEGLWAIPHGVTLNSYFVQGEKTALIDLTASWEEAVRLLQNQLAMLEKTKDIDYLILNHLEPDHTGYLCEFIKKNPNIEIVATAKALALVKDFLKVTDIFPNVKTRQVKDKDTLDLGGVTLTFFEIPNVHWPETMCTYEKASGTLFSCDAFGGYGKTGDKIFDSEFTNEEHLLFEKESLRYYATIVSSFSTFVKKAIDKLQSANLSIKTIAPSHGIVWKEHPEEIINRYMKYAQYNTGGKCENSVCVICASMYGNTQKAAQILMQSIKDENTDIQVDFIKIPDIDMSYALESAYKSRVIVIAAPTYEYKLFPTVAYFLDLCNRKHFLNKTALRIGSYGWVGGAKREYDTLCEPLKWQQLEPYEWQGVLSKKDTEVLKQKGKEIANILAQ